MRKSPVLGKRQRRRRVRGNRWVALDQDDACAGATRGHRKTGDSRSGPEVDNRAAEIGLDRGREEHGIEAAAVVAVDGLDCRDATAEKRIRGGGR
jgi:hypothetical protein